MAALKTAATGPQQQQQPGLAVQLSAHVVEAYVQSISFRCMLGVLRRMWLAQGQFAPRSATCSAVAIKLPCFSHRSVAQSKQTLSSPCGSTNSSRSFAVCAAAAKDSLRESNDSSSSVPEAVADTRLRIAQLLGIRLPSYCSGCGVKLQQIDPDGPG